MKQKEMKLYKQSCPVCNRPTILADAVAEDKKKEIVALWYKCNCGVIFQQEPPKIVPKDKQYIDNHQKIKEWDLVSIHAVKLYAPIIEEMTYGRKLLDVGFCTPNVMDYYKARGWICWGIDINKDIKNCEYSFPGDRIIQNNFETFPDFYEKNFNVIWMSFVLEEFNNPVQALRKCWRMLEEDGVLYISTPDIDFIQTELHHWPHYKKAERNVLWSTRALERELKKVGFEVIVKRRNFASRFGYDRDIQMIAQKPYF